MSGLDQQPVPKKKLGADVFDSDWMEFDSHSDLVVEHDLGKLPTEVVVWVGRLIPEHRGTQAHIRGPRQVPILAEDIVVGAMSIRIPQTAEFREAVQVRDCNRFKIQALSKGDKTPYKTVEETVRPKKGSFLDELSHLGE